MAKPRITNVGRRPQPDPGPTLLAGEHPVATPQYQTVGQSRPLNRNHHVFLKEKREDGTYKCASCGGVTREPSLDGLCESYEPVTADERALVPGPFACPLPRGGKP